MSKSTKLQDAEKVVDLLNPEAIMKINFAKILQKKLTNIEPVIKNKIIQKMADLLDTKTIKKTQAELYLKHYTHDEIKDTLKFYNSKTGKKILEQGPKLILELATAIELWSIDELKKNNEKIMAIVNEAWQEYYKNNPSQLDKIEKITTKQEFALAYAISKGWSDDLTKLTTDQMAEIMSQETWEKLK